MTLWPQSLVGRNAMLIVGLILLAEVGSAVLVRQLIVKPRVEQIAESVARNVASARAGLAALPPSEREAFLAAFSRRATPGVPGTAPAPRTAAARLSSIDRLFVRSVSARLAAEDMDVIWRRDDNSLSLRLRIDGAPYWLALPGVLPERAFTGAWLVASVTAALLALVGALAIQRRIERPLRALVRAARTLGGGGRPEPLPEDGPTEIATVSRSFNQLVHTLDAAERERAIMLAGISHDLRTPMTKLQLGIEIVGDGIEPELSASLKRSIAEMDAVVGQFLDFARADESALPLESTRLDAIAREVAASFADHGQALVLEASSVPVLMLRAALIRRAVSNLVENALRHGRPPVVLRTGRDAAAAWIEVVDQGPGIAPAEVEAMKRPFHRAGSARSGAAGAGLGLAIVERVARSHGATLELMPETPHGLRARLRFPLPAAD
ncbi:MAG: ATP-binding protein [Caldimonas sp.]